MALGDPSDGSGIIRFRLFAPVASIRLLAEVESLRVRKEPVLWLWAGLLSFSLLWGQGSTLPGPEESQKRLGPERYPDRTTVSLEWLLIPEKARKELFKGIRESRGYRPEKAIKYLKKAVDLYPSFYEAYNLMALQYLRLQQRERAVEILNKSIEVEKNNPVAYRRLGSIHLRSQQYGQALKTLRGAYRKDSPDPRVLTGLADAYYGLGQYLLALGFYNEAERHAVPSPALYLRQGYCNWKLARLDQALTHFRRYLRERPSGPKSDEIRGLIAQVQSDKNGPETESSPIADIP